jgi:hypothetical protein
LIDRAEAVFVFFITAHKIKFKAFIFKGPLQNVTEQNPAGGKIRVCAIDTSVIAPQYIGLGLPSQHK